MQPPVQPCAVSSAQGVGLHRPSAAARDAPLLPRSASFLPRRPGLNNWNLALHKSTSIREGTTLQTRAEFFNAFSHEQFANPNRVLSNSRFGVIGSRA